MLDSDIEKHVKAIVGETPNGSRLLYEVDLFAQALCLQQKQLGREITPQIIQSAWRRWYEERFEHLDSWLQEQALTRQ